MTHPLTDEICEELSPWYIANFDEYDADRIRKGMRAAYDMGYTQGLEDASDMVTRLQRKGMLQSTQANKEDNQ